MHLADPTWENIKRELEGACAESGRAARAKLTHELNQLLRRLRQYQTEAEWVSTLLEAASGFVQQAAVFAFKDDLLVLRGQINLLLAPDLSFSAKSAPAFASAAYSKDPVIAIRTAAEVSPALSSTSPYERAHILPIVNGDRAVALLFAADSEPVDGNALELLAGMGSIILERQSNMSRHAQIAPAPPLLKSNDGLWAIHSRSGTSRLPSWAGLDQQQRALHVRAQRFSRVSVAEMQIARPEACRAGREQSNLYLFLKKEIDKARETFRGQFLTIPSMVDYLHLELVHTAAGDDEQKLGADYPGQLV